MTSRLLISEIPVEATDLYGGVIRRKMSRKNRKKRG
jgi:hypothetical protein